MSAERTVPLQIPEELIEQWENHKEPGIKLGTIRIYKQSQKMRLIVPKPPSADPDEPPLRHYKMRMLDKSVKNALVLTDKPKSPDSENRARKCPSTGAAKRTDPGFRIDCPTRCLGTRFQHRSYVQSQLLGPYARSTGKSGAKGSCHDSREAKRLRPGWH